MEQTNASGRGYKPTESGSEPLVVADNRATACKSQTRMQRDSERRFGVARLDVAGSRHSMAAAARCRHQSDALNIN